MKLGAFFFGGVEMTDAGAGAPAPMDRRHPLPVISLRRGERLVRRVALFHHHQRNA